MSLRVSVTIGLDRLLSQEQKVASALICRSKLASQEIGLIEKVDVMAEIPGFVKAVVSYVAGAKPYIYQASCSDLPLLR
jgi:hypothetical protein